MWLMQVETPCNAVLPPFPNQPMPDPYQVPILAKLDPLVFTSTLWYGFHTRDDVKGPCVLVYPIA
jgi:hypothetical protein